jgi:hypothetical protein
VDANLFLFKGRQVTYLKADDLPVAADAIVRAIRKQAHVVIDRSHNVTVIRLEGFGVDVSIRGEDWVKILPYLEDGSLDPIEYPTRNVGLQTIVEASALDSAYTDLYRRTLGILKLIFLPTSNP